MTALFKRLLEERFCFRGGLCLLSFLCFPASLLLWPINSFYLFTIALWPYSTSPGIICHTFSWSAKPKALECYKKNEITGLDGLAGFTYLLSYLVQSVKKLSSTLLEGGSLRADGRWDPQAEAPPPSNAARQEEGWGGDGGERMEDGARCVAPANHASAA